ncbi:MAG: phosphonoacetaldehyde reductase [Actinomycetota bacterium]
MNELCAPGSIDTLRPLIDSADPAAVLVFTGGRSYKGSGAASVVDDALHGRSVSFIRDIPADPDAGNVNDAISVFRSEPPDLVIAIGGGSVIDLAKAVRVLAPITRDAALFLTGERSIQHPGPPMIAVPTTAGTGSEATRYAVFTVGGQKRPMAHEHLLPESVILDPELTYSLPPAVTASTGLDALAQAMESMWSTRSTDASYSDARTALRLALDHLENAVHSPTPESRAAMCAAAHLAGRAIDVSATTAPHALSFHLTTEYGVPHGHAVALTLGATLEYNAAVSDADCADRRGSDHVRTAMADVLDLLGVATPEEGRHLLDLLVGDLALEPTLAGVGVVSTDQRRRLAASASPIRMATNPRRFDEPSLQELIASIA